MFVELLDDDNRIILYAVVVALAGLAKKAHAADNLLPSVHQTLPFSNSANPGFLH